MSKRRIKRMYIKLWTLTRAICLFLGEEPPCEVTFPDDELQLLALYQILYKYCARLSIHLLPTKGDESLEWIESGSRLQLRWINFQKEARRRM